MGTRTRVSILATIVLPIWAIAAQPDWAMKDTQKMSGSMFSVVCSGQAPSLDLARKEALESCQSTAARQLLANITVKEVSMTTEKDVAFHQEISSSSNFSNLSCIPKNESIESESDHVKIWLLCEFNLEKIKATLPPREPTLEQNDLSAYTGDQGLNAVSPKFGKIRLGETALSARKLITISTIPQCSDILIRGKLTRVMKCRENPLSVVIEDSDSEAIVRANGYLSKTIKLKQRVYENGIIEVVLESK